MAATSATSLQNHARQQRSSRGEAKKTVSRDDLKENVLTAFEFEPVLRRAIGFELTRHEPNELSVNWTVKLLCSDPESHKKIPLL